MEPDRANEDPPADEDPPTTQPTDELINVITLVASAVQTIANKITTFEDTNSNMQNLEGKVKEQEKELKKQEKEINLLRKMLGSEVNLLHKMLGSEINHLHKMFGSEIREKEQELKEQERELKKQENELNLLHEMFHPRHFRGPDTHRSQEEIAQGAGNDEARASHKIKTRKGQRKCIFCNRKAYQANHRWEDCPEITNPTTRYEKFMEAKRCTTCAKTNHTEERCPSRRTCNIEGCTEKHHASLHHYYNRLLEN